MKTSKTYAFTLIELLVVISIIAILAGIALPVFGQVQIRGQQTKAISNVKQIGTALKLYSLDNNGIFPSYKITGGKAGTSQVTTSNEAFAQLIPDYMPSEDIFWLTKSKWCNATPPDNKIDSDPMQGQTDSLTAGENEWAYVLGLNDTSNPQFPLIANGFTNETSHTYSVNETDKGGVWRGKNAIVLRVDSSASVVKASAGSGGGSDQRVLKGPIGGTTDMDIFVTGQTGWLGTDNKVVNPVAPTSGGGGA